MVRTEALGLERAGRNLEAGDPEGPPHAHDLVSGVEDERHVELAADVRVEQVVLDEGVAAAILVRA